MPFARLTDCRLYYQESGGGSEIVLVHGLGVDHRLMALLARSLDGECRRLVMDLRGHGRSSWRPTDSVGDLADDLTELLDQLAFGQPVFVGYSLGGAVAMELARRRGAAALVLIATGLRHANPAAIPLRSRQGLTRADIQSVPDVRSRYESLIARPRRAADPLVLAQLGQALGRYQLADHRVVPDIPTLVIGGEIDEYFPPETQEQLLSLFPRGELHILPDTTHGLIVEQPERCQGLIRDFLARHGIIGDGGRS